MALAVLVCGGCGERIPPERITGELRSCPGCGEKLELPAGLRLADGVSCAVCGARNPAGEKTCASCGARLPEAGKEMGRPRKRASGGPPAPDRTTSRHRVDPWQVVSGVAILALIAFLVATQWPREQAAQTPSVLPSQETLPDLSPLEKAVAAAPNDAGALLRLANALHDTKQFARAAMMYSRYLALVPGDPDARVDMGTCYFEMATMDSLHADSLYARAIGEMKRVAASHPAHQAAAYNLGIVHLATGRLSEAGAWFRKAYDIDSTSVLGKKAQMLLQQHQQFPSPE